MKPENDILNVEFPLKERHDGVFDNKLPNRDYLSKNNSSILQFDFPEYLEMIRVSYGIGKEELFSRASISSSYGHEIFKGLKHPTRNKVLQFAFGMSCDLDKTQELLWLARHAILDDLFEWDAVIISAIEKKLSVTKTNLLLFENNLPLLFDIK
jgi:hypothetical protein